MAGAAVQGRGHKIKGIPCQDKVACNKRSHSTGDFYGVALADGAGSCAHSHVGAEYISKRILDHIAANFSRLINLKHPSQHLIRVIEIELAALADSHQIDLRELSSTLMFVCIKGDQCISGHIGDGVIGILNSENKLKVLSFPENGEYSNSTFFTTSVSHTKRLRLNIEKLSDAAGFILMSDGSCDSLYEYAKTKLSPVAANIINWLDNNEEAVADALRSNMEELFLSKTTDDCSIVVMKKLAGVSPSLTIQHPS